AQFGPEGFGLVAETDVRHTGLIAIALLFAAGVPAAETAQQRGKRVVYDALEALGGRAYLKMEDRVEVGRAYSFFHEKLQGLSIAHIYTRYLAPEPGKVSVRERQNFSKDESY